MYRPIFFTEDRTKGIRPGREQALYRGQDKRDQARQGAGFVQRTGKKGSGRQGAGFGGLIKIPVINKIPVIKNDSLFLKLSVNRFV